MTSKNTQLGFIFLFAFILCSSGLVVAQKNKANEKFAFIDSTSLVVYGNDSLFIRSYDIEHCWLNDSVFVEQKIKPTERGEPIIFDSDTFLIDSNGDWYIFNSKRFMLFYSGKIFDDLSYSLSIQKPGMFPEFKDIFRYTPQKKLSNGLFIYEVVNTKSGEKYHIYFDPNVGIIRKFNNSFDYYLSKLDP
ncbi:MAG: hypothetical protein AB8F95_08795 [Bacteroidia bacterium]